MRFWVKIGLFLCSYFPLFVILCIKNWFDLYLTILLSFVLIYSCIWILIIKYTKQNTKESYHILDVENKTKESLTYIIPYLIAFSNFDFHMWGDWASLMLLLLILFVICIKSELLFINPILSLFDYRIYRLTVQKLHIQNNTIEGDILLLSQNTLKKDMIIYVKDIDNDVRLEVRK